MMTAQHHVRTPGLSTSDSPPAASDAGGTWPFYWGQR
jgi:hypothetical protein